MLHYLNYLHERKTVLENIKPSCRNILQQIDSFINNVLLFGDTFLNNSSNTFILNTTINYIRSTNRSIFTSIFKF